MIRTLLLVVTTCVALLISTDAWIPSQARILEVSRHRTISARLSSSQEGDSFNKSAEDDISQDEESSIIIEEEKTGVSPQLRRQVQPKPELSANDLMLAMGTNPRRIAISFLSASGIALAGNFLGVTSKLLMAVNEDTVEATGLDTYFPRGTSCGSKLLVRS
jgi:hypothetical protein